MYTTGKRRSLRQPRAHSASLDTFCTSAQWGQHLGVVGAAVRGAADDPWCSWGCAGMGDIQFHILDCRKVNQTLVNETAESAYKLTSFDYEVVLS